MSAAAQVMDLSNCACPVIHVANKCDLLPLELERRRTNGNPTLPIFTSAVSGEGVSVLAGAIVDRLVGNICPGDAVPFTIRQLNHLRTTMAAIELADSQSARASLELFLG